MNIKNDNGPELIPKEHRIVLSVFRIIINNIYFHCSNLSNLSAKYYIEIFERKYLCA